MLQNDEELSQAMAYVLEVCLDRGMQLPFHLACVGLNGSTIVARYVEGQEHLDCEILAQHYEGLGFKLPVNVMVVDKTGEAARITWGGPELVAH